MKKLIITVALLLVSLFLSAQDKDSVVVLPSHIADSVILDLEYKDYLVYELHKRDSSIAVYTTDLAERLTLVKTLQLNVDEYKVLVSKLEEDEKIYERKNVNDRKKINHLQRKAFGLGTLSVLELVIIFLLLL